MSRSITESKVKLPARTLVNSPKAVRQYSLEEFLKKEAKSKERHEFYNGRISKLPMASGSHNIIVANITAAFVHTFTVQSKPYLVFGAQQLVYLPDLNFGLYPDVLVVAEAPEYWDKNEILLINPILIVEVLSKSTKAYDRTEKFAEYKTLESFREYVLVDPGKYSIETRFREAPDLWRDTSVTGIDQSILLKSVNIELPLASVYRHNNL